MTTKSPQRMQGNLSKTGHENDHDWNWRCDRYNIAITRCQPITEGSGQDNEILKQGYSRGIGGNGGYCEIPVLVSAGEPISGMASKESVPSLAPFMETYEQLKAERDRLAESHGELLAIIQDARHCKEVGFTQSQFAAISKAEALIDKSKG